MLVTNRRIGDWITLVLPDSRKVRVLVKSIDGRRVKLGVDASRDVNVRLEELKPLGEKSDG